MRYAIVLIAGCITVPPKTGESGDTGSDLPVASFHVTALDSAGIYFVTATFRPATEPSTTTPISTVPPGACALVPIVVDVDPAVELDPGDVTVTLDGVGVPVEDGYAALDGWPPAGSAVSFAATGAELPAFDVQDLLELPPTPSPVTVTAAAGTTITVSWTGVVAGARMFVVVTPAYGSTSLVCTADDTGSFVVDPGGAYNGVVVYREVSASQAVGDVLVEATATIGG